MIKFVSRAGIFWFSGCAVYVLSMSVRQQGAHSPISLPLDDHSFVLFFLLAGTAIFTWYRKTVRMAVTKAQHPLSRTGGYRFFFGVIPFLAAAAALTGLWVNREPPPFLPAITSATVIAAFCAWIIVEPVVEVIEWALPASRKHRTQRSARLKSRRECQKSKQMRQINELKLQHQREQKHWEELLQPHAERLVELITNDDISLHQRETEAVDIALVAWRLGGYTCMQHLHHMATELGRRQHQDLSGDPISLWWDGVGKWRHPSALVKV